MKTKEEIINKILKYKGNDAFVLGLQDRLLKSEELTTIQLSIADKKFNNFSRDKKNTQKKESRKHINKDINSKLIPYKVTDNEIINLLPTVYDFQKKGIKWLIDENRSKWLMDEQGLGKTLQTIVACMLANFDKVIIICPNYLKWNWFYEIKGLTDNVQMLSERNLANLKQFNIVNYESVHKYVEYITKFHIVDCTIIDESQYIKNTDSRRHLFTLPLASHSKRIWLLTGTAKDNKVYDLFGQLKMLNHELSENKFYFLSRYCNSNEENELDFTGASNINELHQILKSTVMLRRLKKDVLKDIPDKNETVINLHLDSFKKYKKLVDDYVLKTENPEFILGGISHLAQLMILKQFLAIEKIHSVCELIDNIIENTDDKIVVFSNFTKVIETYLNRYSKISVRHDGKIDENTKKHNISEFKNNKNIRIMFCQFQNSHAGLNLQVANNVIFNESAQTPGIDAQAQDRIHRIGQDKECNYLYPLFKNTIDESIYNLFKQEKLISGNLLDGQDNHIQIDLFKMIHRSILNQLSIEND